MADTNTPRSASSGSMTSEMISDSNSRPSSIRPLRVSDVSAIKGGLATVHRHGDLHAELDNERVCIGIGGGVGPAAGVMLHKKIIEATVSDGTDQSHCEVHHISRPGVADRTRYLLGLSEENPAVGMAQTMAALAESARSSGKLRVVAGVPCNTFHAPKIWDDFLAIMEEEGTSATVQMVHMLDETVAAIHQVVPGATKIGLLSTTGTRESRVYANLLEPAGFELVQVDPDDQPAVHDAIYNKEWGVKAVQPTSYQAAGEFARFARDLKARGADAIILGCTEIPLALPEATFDGVPLIDPMAVLARAVIRRAGALALDFAPRPEPPVACCSVDSTSSIFQRRSARPPVWQQHAAAFVIQSHWRAHLAARKAYHHLSAVGRPASVAHDEYFRNSLCCSPSGGSIDVGCTPEYLTPGTSGIAAAMLRVTSTDELVTHVAGGETIMT